MMKRQYWMTMVCGCLLLARVVYAGELGDDASARPSAAVGTLSSHNAFKIPYLGMDGAFTIDPKTITATDPRNPKRVVLDTMEFFSFYKDRAGRRPLAERCQYVYKGAAGDPYYHPAIAKTSVVVF